MVRLLVVSMQFHQKTPGTTYMVAGLISDITGFIDYPALTMKLIRQFYIKSPKRKLTSYTRLVVFSV